MPALRPLLLVLDDDPMVCAVYARFLLTFVDPTAYEVAAVTTPEPVFAALATRSLPILVTDYHLVGTTGLEVARRVKAQSPATQILLVTASPLSALPPNLTTYGIDQVFQKPVTLAAFTAWCTNALRTWEALGGEAMSVGAT